MELQVQAQELTPIQANLAELQGYVEGVVSKYKYLVYTDEQIKLAKNDRADLRHLKEDIEAKRKALKAKWNAPYLAFEGELKKITALIDEPVALIDGQIKDFEARRKEERLSKLNAVFERHNPLGELLEFERLLDPKWLNASVSDAKAVSSLVDKLEHIQKDIAQLESVISAENRTVCIEKYLSCFNLADAILHDTLLKAKKAKQEAILGSVVNENEPKPQPVQPTEVKRPAPEQGEEEDIFADLPPQEPKDYPETRRFIVTGTPAQVNALTRWACENGLKMREVF